MQEEEEARGSWGDELQLRLSIPNRFGHQGGLFFFLAFCVPLSYTGYVHAVGYIQEDEMHRTKAITPPHSRYGFRAIKHRLL